MRHTLLYIVLAFFFIACSANNTNTVTTNGSFIRLINGSTKKIRYSKEQATKVKVFYQKKPDFNFIEIGIVEAIAYGDNVGLKDLFPELKKQAYLAGGIAIHKIELRRFDQTGNAMHATAIAINKKQ